MRVALLIRGITFDDKFKHWTGKLLQIDYKNNLQNVISKVIIPLKKSNDVDLYLTTYHSIERPKQMLLNDFDIECIENVTILERNDTKQMDSFLTGLKTIQASAKEYDFIIVTRFDLDLKYNIDLIPWDCNKVNFLWYETSNDNRVGDCMHFIPLKFLNEFIECLSICPYRTCCHYVKNYLDPIIGINNINIIFKEKYWSNTDDGENPLYVIKRGKILGYRSFNTAARILGKSNKKFLFT